MSAISDSALLAQIQAGIRVNGNMEITPPIHKAIEDNIVNSKLSIVDGGNVIQALTGYSTDLTPTDNKHLVPKKYVDDELTNGQTENFNWRFNTSTTASDPGAGFFRANNATASLVTALYVDSICSETGLDIDTIFTVIDGNWSIYIQQIGDSTKFAQYSTTGTYTNNGGWWTIPVTYIQSGAGGGLTNNAKCVFYLTNNNSISSNVTIDINGVEQDLSTNREWRTGLADTGVLTYTGASIASSTQINIGAATGWIIDNETNPAIPTKTYINYAGESNKTVTTLGSGLATYVLLNSSGTIVFQNTFPTSAERKTMIYLSKIGHPMGSIITVGNEPDHILSPISQLRNLTKYIGFINSTVYASANGANLNINLSSGTVYRHNGNFVADDTNPGDINVAAATVASFLYRTQTGSGGGFVTAIDPTVYDNSGTSTAIGGSSNQATNQRIYLVPGLGLIVQQGQTIYTTLTDAIAAVNNESFVVYPSLINNAILIGVLSVTKGCTALNNSSTARFFNTDKFGQVAGATAGISTAVLQSTYDNSSTPEIVTNSTLGALSIKRGSGADTDNIFEGLNGSGTTTFSIDGNGGVNQSGVHVISNTSESTSASDGALRIAGGVWAAKRLNVGPSVAGPLAQLSVIDDIGGGVIAQFISASSATCGIKIWNNASVSTSNKSQIYHIVNNSLGATTAVLTSASLSNTGSGSEVSDYSIETYNAGVRAERFLISGNTTTISTSTVRLTAVSLLDTTYKTGLDVSSANVLRVGSGFTSITTPATSLLFTGGVSSISVTGGTSLTLSQNSGGASASVGILVTRNSSISNTSGNTTMIDFGSVSFAPTSGTGNLSVVKTSITLNQTGSSGIISMIDIVPTVTDVSGTLYGLRSQIASGTNRWNIYAEGTASNHIAGNTGIGTTTVTAAFLTIGASTTSKAAMNFISGTAPSSPNDGDFWFDGTNVKIRVAGVTKTFTLT